MESIAGHRLRVEALRHGARAMADSFATLNEALARESEHLRRPRPLPQVDHSGLWGLGKAWDADCYVYSKRASYKVPEDIRLKLYRGNDLSGRRFRLVPWEGWNGIAIGNATGMRCW